MPKPRDGESKDAFIERCMAYPDMQSMDPKQRAGRCYGIWDEHSGGGVKKSAPMSLVYFKATPEIQVLGDERCDVSTITSKAIDSQGDIIIPDGLDWDRFHEDGSPVHYAHHSLRVGRALWIKSKGDRIIAKTKYDSAPANWAKDKPWLGDLVLDAVKKGALPGKSITVLPTDEREPTKAEADLGAKRVIVKGTVMEFSVCKTPINQDAVVEEICKALDAFNPVVVEELNQTGHLNDLVAQLKGVFEELQAGGR